MRIAIVVLLVACGSDSAKQPDAHVDLPVDAPAIPDAPPGCHTEKLAFTQATGCQNDGSVEFCIPTNMGIEAMLQTIEPAIHCAAGGGRAMCNATPNLLLCTYPLAFPAQCATDHGAMTGDTFGDMCSIAAIPQVTMIVHTILE